MRTCTQADLVQSIAYHIEAPFRVVGAVLDAAPESSLIDVMGASGQRWEFDLNGKPAKDSTPRVVNAVALAVRRARGELPPAPEPAVVPSEPLLKPPTHAEIIEANARVQQELAPAKVALEIGRVLERGEASVHGAPGDAFGLPIDWSDVEGRVSWHAWLSPVAVELGCPAPTWAALERDSDWSERARAGVLHIWREALSRGVPLPSVLDLRGLPTAHGLLLERYQAPLKTALAQVERGIVLLVDTNAWALARCLA